MKNFEGWILTRSGWDVRHRDGRPQGQVHAAVRARSRAAAARALDVSERFISQYFAETGNRDTIAALDGYEPGTVLLRPMDPRGSVLGQDGWIARPETQ